VERALAMSIAARPHFPTTYAMMASGWRSKERLAAPWTWSWCLECWLWAFIYMQEQIPARKIAAGQGDKWRREIKWRI